MESLSFYPTLNNLGGLGNFIEHGHLFLLEVGIYSILI